MPHVRNSRKMWYDGLAVTMHRISILTKMTQMTLFALSVYLTHITIAAISGWVDNFCSIFIVFVNDSCCLTLANINDLSNLVRAS